MVLGLLLVYIVENKIMLIRSLGVAVAAVCKFIRTIVASSKDVRHDLRNKEWM